MKSGFVSLIGRTNAGKSSFLNYILGEKISLVSHKVNATRRKINGIVMHGDDQIIFVDTPGLHESNKMMNKIMVEVALNAIGDSDLVLFLAPIHDSTENYEKFLNLHNGVNHIVLLTKIDEANDEKIVKKLSEYQKFQDKFGAIIPINIKKNVFKRQILDEICKFLPEHEYFYDPELISSTNLRDIYRDFILESIFENTNSELPYSTDVIIEKVNETPNLISIYAKIITDTQSHKQILIGKNGDTIKRIGIKSKKLISAFSKVKIYVKLSVFVKKSWKNDENSIKSHFIY
ncbi:MULTISPECIES: GTPase Era [unclassified Campylobacter]|uniref:GTPase Era n=1 Tax=unclassified Campylobacter TaxID=2593542 RepID=UPI0022E9EB4C|nr:MULTISPECIES: GTPase Era [unclassified Campylobacter]MDA3055810.1 GTPase Era [Campylobacter sp. CN_NA1]MDA3065904.1 GTPase Era [Campylobacter sp. CN_NE4]MDA3068666.1 GTPase Era [Campylobacter sp. CN_NE3]MDA3082011.1 GTPase Era [Campylobacter sp. CN_EL2]MDA3084251.1 GTPase Era [Campylobacter sp. CN_NE1]